MSEVGGRRAVNLALQGGGSHGAFSWGVLDRLLEDGRIGFEGISGTSAGAMNAVVLAFGMMTGGHDGARQALADFWEAVAREGAKSPIRRNPINRLFGDWSLDSSPSYIFFDLMSRLASPYETNPLDINPLRALVENRVDFERLRACTRTRLFLSATNVHTGRVRVFRTDEISVDVVMASACLPLMFKAVEIDGIPYWDGGFMGNPALFPFFDACASEDILLVQINPMERRKTPKTAREILDRMNEITFNASLMKEFRAIEFVDRLIEQGKLDAATYKQVKLHRIHDEEGFNGLSASSKVNAERDFLIHLRERGRQVAELWLETCLEHLGRKSTVDIRALFA